MRTRLLNGVAWVLWALMWAIPGTTHRHARLILAERDAARREGALQRARDLHYQQHARRAVHTPSIHPDWSR